AFSLHRNSSVIHACNCSHLFGPSANAHTTNSSLAHFCPGRSFAARVNQYRFVFLGEGSPSLYSMDCCLHWLIRGTACVVSTSLLCRRTLVVQKLEYCEMDHDSADCFLRRCISGDTCAATAVLIVRCLPVRLGRTSTGGWNKSLSLCS